MRSWTLPLLDLVSELFCAQTRPKSNFWPWTPLECFIKRKVHRRKSSIKWSKGSLTLLYCFMASRLGALVNVYGIVNSAKYQDTFSPKTWSPCLESCRCSHIHPKHRCQQRNHYRNSNRCFSMAISLAVSKNWAWAGYTPWIGHQPVTGCHGNMFTPSLTSRGSLL